MDIESQLSSISEARRNTEKLPAGLISSGVGQAAAAFGLCVFKAPGGIFLHHGEAAVYLYYGILIVILIFGLFEAFVGQSCGFPSCPGSSLLALGALPS
ncbi:hypothetical protein ACP4OV_026388 [Aristida adscensionis]